MTSNPRISLKRIVEKPAMIFVTSIFVVVLFSNLPMSPGYELALAFIPIFILALGLLISLLYWLLIILTKKKYTYVFYFMLISNLLIGLIITYSIYSI